MALNTGLNALNQKPINQNGATLNTSQMVQGAFGMPVSTSGQTSPTVQNTITSSPALSAMAGTARPLPAPSTGATPRPQPNVGSGGGNTAAEEHSPWVTPTTVDTSKQDQIYQDQLAQSNKAWDYMQANNANTMSALQRRNASNAALSGFSVGGGSYLAGQRSAAVAGINAANQAAMNWLNQRTGIMQGAAGLASNAASQNAALGQQGGMSNADYQRQIDTAKTTAQTTQNANQTVGSVNQVHADYDYLFNDHNLKSGAGQYNSLLTAFQNSLTTGNAQEQAAAYQALMAYITPIQQAREAWLQQGGDKKMSFADFYKLYYGGK